MTELKKELETASTDRVMSAPTELYKILEEQVILNIQALTMDILY